MVRLGVPHGLRVVDKLVPEVLDEGLLRGVALGVRLKTKKGKKKDRRASGQPSQRDDGHTITHKTTPYLRRDSTVHGDTLLPRREKVDARLPRHEVVHGVEHERRRAQEREHVLREHADTRVVGVGCLALRDERVGRVHRLVDG